MSPGLPVKAGVAANVLLAAGAVLLKPALDSLLIPDSSVTTLSGRIDVSHSSGLALLEPALKWNQHHDIVAPFLRTTKPILSSMPLLLPSSITAATGSGVMFGMAATFLSLAAAGGFLVRSHSGHEPGEPGGRFPSSLSETLAHNRDQRQAQNRRMAAASRRRSRGAREFLILCLRYWLTSFILTCSQLPIPCRPITIRTIDLLRTSRPCLVSCFLRINSPFLISTLEKLLQVGVGIQVGAPPPPPPPPPPAAVAVHPDDMGRTTVMNVLLKCLFALSFIIIYVKSISTSNCSYPQVDDILVESDRDNTSSSMPPNLLEPMEPQHFPADLPSRLRALLARFQVVHKAICGFVPPFFASESPCFFLRLVMDYLLCTLLCWILSSICALASGSACTEIHRVKEDEIISVEVSLNEHVCFFVLFMFRHSYINSTILSCPVKTSLHRWILGNPSRYAFIIALLF